MNECSSIFISCRTSISDPDRYGHMWRMILSQGTLIESFSLFTLVLCSDDSSATHFSHSTSVSWSVHHVPNICKYRSRFYSSWPYFDLYWIMDLRLKVQSPSRIIWDAYDLRTSFDQLDSFTSPSSNFPLSFFSFNSSFFDLLSLHTFHFGFFPRYTPILPSSSIVLYTVFLPQGSAPKPHVKPINNYQCLCC